MVRLIIEREIIPGNEPKVRHLLTQLRGKALNVKGYVTGETLQAIDNPSKFLVVSTWNTLDDWKAWEKNDERKEVEAKIEPLLRYPAKITAYAQG